MEQEMAHLSLQGQISVFINNQEMRLRGVAQCFIQGAVGRCRQKLMHQVRRVEGRIRG